MQSADSLVLYDIACLDPLINGSGVYQARTILDWDGFCKHNDNKSAQVFNNENEVSFSSSTIVYRYHCIFAKKIDHLERRCHTFGTNSIR
jgi:hypothetical protein